MRRTMAILVCAIFTIPAIGQINIGNMKDNATQVTNEVPKQKEVEKDLKQKECESDRESVRDYIASIREAQNADDLDRAKTYLMSAQNRLGAIEEDVENKKCNVDISKEKTELAEVEAVYKQKIDALAALSDFKEADFEIVKKAVWSIDPLKNQINFGNVGMFEEMRQATQFYNSCKEIDFINKAPDVVAISKKYPDEFQEGYEMGSYLNDFTVKFPAFLDEQLSFLQSEINNAMMAANKTKAKGSGFLEQAMETANAALITAEGCLILYPDNKTILALREKALANYQSIASEYAATTYTSDIHANNAGRIVFSTSPIQIGSENESSFKTSFNSNETIYGMMYLKNNLLAIQGSRSMTTKIFANGSVIAEHEWYASPDCMQNTYNDAEIMPEPSSAETYGALKFYEAFATMLLPGVNKIKVVLTDEGNNVVAEGEFDLDCSAGADGIVSRYKELKDIRLEQVRMPDSKISDPALEASMVSAMAAQNWPEKAMRAVITGDSWITHRGAMGEILFREMYAAVAFKTPEGLCKIFYMSFKQDYNGSGYGITKYYSVGGNEEIKCENVYK